MNHYAFLGDADRRHLQRLLHYVTAVAALLGLVLIPSLDLTAAYMVVLMAALAPSYVWLRLGAPGMPIFPTVGLVYLLYFGVPLLTGNIGTYQASDIFHACLTVSGFLVLATLVWRAVILHRVKQTASRQADPSLGRLSSNKFLMPFIQISLIVGLTIQIAALEGLLGWMGPFFSVFRTIALSATSVASFLIGYATGAGALPKNKRTSIYAALGTAVLVQLSGLYLAEGAVYIAAAIFGYVISTKRIPWKTLVVLLVGMSLLHDGKAEMRRRYWYQGTMASSSVLHTPALMAEWIGVSLNQLAGGNRAQPAQSLVDRASLLTQLVRVQQFTPQRVPYLNGDTYLLFPVQFIPRFILPDKLSSQIVAHILSVRYGLMQAEQTASTTIGWGIIAEAFANFGYVGVGIAAVIFGLVVGCISALSIGTAALSLSNLLAVTGLLTLISVEMDFGFLLLNLWQAVIAMSMFYYFLRFLLDKGENPAPRPSAQPAE